MNIADLTQRLINWGASHGLEFQDVPRRFCIDVLMEKATTRGNRDYNVRLVECRDDRPEMVNIYPESNTVPHPGADILGYAALTHERWLSDPLERNPEVFLSLEDALYDLAGDGPLY